MIVYRCTGVSGFGVIFSHSIERLQQFILNCKTEANKSDRITVIY